VRVIVVVGVVAAAAGVGAVGAAAVAGAAGAVKLAAGGALVEVTMVVGLATETDAPARLRPTAIFVVLPLYAYSTASSVIDVSCPLPIRSPSRREAVLPALGSSKKAM
jgi:hypothetical protein